MDESTLDLTGLRCPAPIVRLNAAIKSCAQDTVLRVLASDPAFELDVRAWCRRTGNELLEFGAGPGHSYARIRRQA